MSIFIHDFAAKSMEKHIQSPLSTCKEASRVCSKLEDEAAAFMVDCYTSSTSVKANILELVRIEAAAKKLVSAVENLLNSSASSSQGFEGMEAVQCSGLISSIVKVQTLFSQTSLVGSGPTIVAQTQVIISQV